MTTYRSPKWWGIFDDTVNIPFELYASKRVALDALADMEWGGNKKLSVREVSLTVIYYENKSKTL